MFAEVFGTAVQQKLEGIKRDKSVEAKKKKEVIQI